ncbi:MAG: hypothetical protein IJ368_05545 [Oscillospiraceae bacterium]|nr:hypothetical protein [Oscillospiraceae bacterium]
MKRNKEKPIYITIGYSLHKEGGLRNAEGKFPICPEHLSALEADTNGSGAEYQAIDNILQAIAYLRGYKNAKITKINIPREVTTNE